MATTVSRSGSRVSRASAQAHSSSHSPNSAKAGSSSLAGSALSSHLAMLELKQRILGALSKLSDRDTYQIAVEDLERIIRTLPVEGVPMLLNSLLHDPPSLEPSSRQSPITARRECLRLLALFCSTHPEVASAHLPKIISHIVRRIKDPSSDTSVRDSCRDTVGSLSSIYLCSPCENYPSLVSLFVKPFLEAMAEQNKIVQAGASACLAKMIECAKSSEGPQESAPAAMAFQKLCPRICKLLGGQSFLAKGALLSVVSSLSQVGAITAQSLPPLLQSVRECLESSDWATRKAAGDTLCILASHSTHLIGENAAAIVSALESSRFDKVKPVRDSIAEALLLWNKLSGHGEDEEETKDRSSPASTDQGEKLGLLLKKKAPSLTDKEPNAEFFQKLETRRSDDLPVEVVVPRRALQSSLSNGGEERETVDDGRRGSGPSDVLLSADGGSNDAAKHKDGEDPVREKVAESRGFRVRDVDSSISESFMNGKGNWLAIQRQLSLLERQQASLMNMLQEFMGGSHDSMVTLENRVRGLERIVDEMARDLSLSSGRRGSGMLTGFDGGPARSTGKYGGFHDHPKGRFSFTDTFDPYPYAGSRPGASSSRRAWEKGSGAGSGSGPGPFRLGEGPSARSVWQASKDEATLEAIRVAGPVPELRTDSISGDGPAADKGKLWASWNRVVDSLHVGDVESAYGEVLSTGDDLLLVKLMDRSGPVLDQLSDEIAGHVLCAAIRFLLEQGLLDIAFSWINQLTEMVGEDGRGQQPMLKGETKREILLGMQEAAASMDPPEEWEGPPPEQMMRRLASAWGINLQRIVK